MISGIAWRFRLPLIILVLAGLPLLACQAAQMASELVPTLGAESGVQIGRLSEETLNQLALSIGESGQAEPGDQLQLKIGVNECCYYFEPLVAKVRWSVEPQDVASIDPTSGLLLIDSDAENGARITITADIERGRKLLKGVITIYRPEDNPLVGVWHEKIAYDCERHEMPTESDLLRELVFKADGTFEATFTPFEIYHDYWGSYTFDPATAQIGMIVEGGNFIPENIDLDGSYTFDSDGNLLLDGIWLGRRAAESQTGCSQLFGR